MGEGQTPEDWQSHYRWARTDGAPRHGEPRDGMLHQLYNDHEREFDLEPVETDMTDDAHYVLADRMFEIDEQGRTVWIYEYVGLTSTARPSPEDED